MATDPLEDIFKRVDDLNSEQKEQLLQRLQSEAIAQNHDAAGRTLFDVFNDFDMIGTIVDAPEDWSTNPKYMEGLGRDAQ